MNSVIEFDEEKHIYSIYGEVLPSVTQLIQVLFGNLYEQVPSQVLKRASDYGTLVHKEIEQYFKYHKKDYLTNEAKTFIEKVIPAYNIKYVMSEKMIALMLHNRFVACGTLDLLAYFDKTLVLCDFKTTSTIHLQEVILQLNLYRKGIKDYLSQDDLSIDIEKLVVIQLKGNNYVVKELPLLKDEVVNERLEIALNLMKNRKDEEA